MSDLKREKISIGCIIRFGAYNLDVYEHYFENGNLVKEVKLSSFRFEGFIERKGSDTD